MRGDKGNHLFHVQTLTSFIVTLQVLGQLRFEHYSELLTKTRDRILGLIFELVKQSERFLMQLRILDILSKLMTYDSLLFHVIKLSLTH